MKKNSLKNHKLGIILFHGMYAVRNREKRMSEDHRSLPWKSKIINGRFSDFKKIYDAQDEEIIDEAGLFYNEDDPDIIVKAVNSHDALIEALEIALPYIESQNNAEGMLDGFSGRKPRPSDNDLERVKQALNTAKGV